MASVAVDYSFHGWNGSCGGCQEDIEATCALVVERIEQLDDKVNDIYRSLRRRIHTSKWPNDSTAAHLPPHYDVRLVDCVESPSVDCVVK